MKKICLLLSVVMILTSFGVGSVFASYNTEIDLFDTTNISLAAGSGKDFLFGANFDSDVLHLSFDLKADESNADGATLWLKMNGDDPTESGADKNDSDQYDYTKVSTSFGRGHRTLRITDANATVFTNVYRWYSNQNTEVTKPGLVAKGQRHKIDLFFNKTAGNRSYDAYVDGTFVGTGWYINNKSIKNFKGIRLDASGGNFELDNIYARKYVIPAGGLKKDIPKICGEYLGGNKVELSFSEAMTIAPTADNFIVKNENGDLVSGIVVENGTVGGCVLNLGGDADGNYTILTTGITGAISGIEPESTKIVASKENPVENGKYMIFREDFQDYKYYKNLVGGDAAYNASDNLVLPTGWANAQTLPLISTSNTEARDKYTDYWNKNNILTFAEGQGNAWTQSSLHFKANAGGIEGNNAFELTTSGYGASPNGSGTGEEHGGYVKYFSNGVATGNFTLEFDVAVSQKGGWSIGLIPYDNYNAAATNGSYGSAENNPTSKYSWNRTNQYGENKFLYQRATLSHIIGQLQNDDKLYVPTGAG